MNEENIIKKVKSLRAIQPSADDLIIVGKKIGRIQRTAYSSRNKYIYVAVGVFIILVFVGFFMSKTLWFQAEVYKVRIFLSQSTYEKAKLSLQLSQKELDFLKENKKDESAMNILIASIATTNTYFSHLNLHGEPGNYSETQCKKLYISFAQYLDDTKKTISITNTTSGTDKKIEAVEKQVDTRLKTYKK